MQALNPTALLAAWEEGAGQTPPRRAITLLTNRGILPLSARARRLAVVGPLADARGEMRGPWSLAGSPDDGVTILEGLRIALPHGESEFEAGVGIAGEERAGIDKACALCAGADVVVLCLGESADMSGEAASRAAPGLPGRQHELAQAVLATGIPVVAVISSGRPLMVTWLVEQAQATLATWFLGDKAGRAIADVLTGRFNPTGRLAVTWPREIGQIPIFYAMRSSSRPYDPVDPYTSKYLDLSVDPLFPFGHGLSFSRVELENLRASREKFRPQDRILVEVDAINRAGAATEETIFLFVHDLAASVARPLLELKDWAKVALDAGQVKTVAFTLTAASFCVLDENYEPALEPGDFDILVGLSADRTSLLKAHLRALER